MHPTKENSEGNQSCLEINDSFVFKDSSTKSEEFIQKNVDIKPIPLEKSDKFFETEGQGFAVIHHSSTADDTSVQASPVKKYRFKGEEADERPSSVGNNKIVPFVQACNTNIEKVNLKHKDKKKNFDHNKRRNSLDSGLIHSTSQ